MPKDNFQEYVWLISRLRRGPATLAELADSFERSTLYNNKPLQPRTLYNWRDKVFDLFDIKIEYDKRDGRYHILEDGDHGGDRWLRWLVQSLAVQETISQRSHLSGRILLEYVPSGDTFLQPILEAMHLGKVIKMEYCRFGQVVGSDYEIEPYCVKVHNRRWYLLANARFHDNPEGDRCRLLIFALDRIVGLESTDLEFSYPEDFDPETYFSEYYGVWTDPNTPLETVLLRVDTVQRDYIETLPLHHTQRLVEENDEYGVYELRLRPTLDFFLILMGLGSYAEVLAPERLRSLMADEISLLNDIYQGKI